MKAPKNLVHSYGFLLIGSLLYSFFLYLTYGSTVPLPQPTLVKIFFNILILPVALLLLFFRFGPNTILSTIPSLLVMIGTGIIVLLADYSAWGVASGSFYTPDGETIAILVCEFFIFSFFICSGMIFSVIYRAFKPFPNKKRRG